MPDMKKSTVELPEYLYNQLEFWMKKFGFTGSEMISYFVRLGIANFSADDITNYLQYRARKTANEAKEGQEG